MPLLFVARRANGQRSIFLLGAASSSGSVVKTSCADPARLPHSVAPLLFCAGSFKSPRPTSSFSSTRASIPSLHDDTIVCHCNSLPSSFPWCPNLLAAADLFPFLSFLPCFCIYFGNIRRQTKHHRLAVSCILSHTFAQSRHTTHISRICSIYLHVPASAIMSFNITSSGSPTPRKGASRFSQPGDLELDTSQEALSQFGGAVSHNHFPYTISRPFGVSLTSQMQGMKLPLGTSTLGNQPMLPQQNAFEGYKVSQLLIHRCQSPCLHFSLSLSIMS